MEIKDAIKKSMKIFADNKGNWDLSEAAIKNSDIPLPLGEKILEFMPLAFGRAFMNDLGVGFKDEYVRYIFDDGKTVVKQRRKLKNEPVFVESLKIASEIISKRSAGKDFQSVAFTSAEFRTVNEMMNKGSEPQNLVLTEPYLQWREELADEKILDSEQEKNWWKFWN
ncbi:hypothetical protein BH20ACI1_BH20ACI1_32270 [soil metagenome]